MSVVNTAPWIDWTKDHSAAPRFWPWIAQSRSCFGLTIAPLEPSNMQRPSIPHDAVKPLQACGAGVEVPALDRRQALCATDPSGQRRLSIADSFVGAAAVDPNIALINCDASSKGLPAVRSNPVETS